MVESEPRFDTPSAPQFSVPPAGYNFPPGVPYFPAGVDSAQAALIAAAYSVQAGKCPLKC